MADPNRPTYLVLDGLSAAGAEASWNVAALERIEAAASSLRLASLPLPPVPLKDAAGTFGGMENPTGVAVAPNGDIYASDSATHRIFRIRRFASGCDCETLVDYVACLGGEGSAPRQLRAPRGLAISRNARLYVADSGNHRVQVFDLHSLKLLAVWPRRTTPAPGNRAGELRDPWDVAADTSGNVWIADRGNGRVQKYDCASRRFRISDGTVLAAHFFEVNYGPDARARFVYVPARGRLEQWLTAEAGSTSDIRLVATDVASVGAARDRLELLLHARGARRLFLEWPGAYPVTLESAQAMAEPAHLAIDGEGRVYVVDAANDFVRVLDADGRLLREVLWRRMPNSFPPAAVAIDAAGRLLLAAADGIHRFLVADVAAYDRCDAQWSGPCGGMSVDDRGRLFAAGSSGILEIADSAGFETAGIYRSRALDSGIDRCPWDKIVITFAAAVPESTSVTVWTHISNEAVSEADIAALEDDQWHIGRANAEDLAIRSPRGRYLWLRIAFAGDGEATPELRRIRVLYPRASYLQYLPAIYQAEPVSRDFLDRFLRLFQTILESIEQKGERFSDYLDPDGTPSAFLGWLAGWIGMTFDSDMADDVRVRLLRNAPELYRRRGTPAGLKLFLRLAFGIDARILEHYRLRKWTFAGDGAVLGSCSALWGACAMPRLQLGVFSRIGEAALIGAGDPLLDPFAVYAHQFSVMVPPSALREPRAEAAVRAAIDREKPAHAQYTLVSLRPRFRVGTQSTLGLDSVVGTYPRLVLGRVGTLGVDALVGAEPGLRSPPPLIVGRRSRVGIGSVVG